MPIKYKSKMNKIENNYNIYRNQVFIIPTLVIRLIRSY
jgi:hypothetical protein